jgi:hypothetical protein
LIFSGSFQFGNCHLLDFLRAAKQRTKNATPKPIKTKRDPHGNGCPRAEARRQRQAWVNGDIERMMLNASGT